MSHTAPTVQLAHGASIPRLGLGTSPMKDDEAERTVAEAIELGYRLIDTAENYRNEVGVGRGIKAAGVPRSELFITTKFNRKWHSVKGARTAFETSAAKLGVDYIDLLLIHWPNPAQGKYVDAWRGLIELLESGHVKAIGTSNFKPVHLRQLLNETGILPDVNQIQLSPFWTREDARTFDAKRMIVTEAWSPLGRGTDLLDHPTVTEIAEAHGKTPAQVVLRWHLDLGVVPIPKSSDPGRLKQNLGVFDFTLTPNQVEALSDLNGTATEPVDSDRTGH
jgi:2,5-diketo-D-gluconate reductase A